MGCERVLLIGGSEGGPGCIHFASRHPERLAGLVLYGSLAKGNWTPDYPFVLTHEQYDLWLRRLIRDWGGPSEIATFAPSLVGNAQAERWWAGLLRAASSPGAIKAVLESLRDTDVRPVLPRIVTPTLVLHRRGDRAVRIEAGRDLAGAKLGRGWSSLMATITGSGRATSAAFLRRFAPSCAASKWVHDRPTRCSTNGRKWLFLAVLAAQ